MHCKGGLLHRTWRQQLSPSCDATAARTPAPRMLRFKASTLLCEVSVFLALESDPVPWLHQPGFAGEVSTECWRSCSQRHGVSHLKARLHLLTRVIHTTNPTWPCTKRKRLADNLRGVRCYMAWCICQVLASYQQYSPTERPGAQCGSLRGQEEVYCWNHVMLMQ